MNLFVIRYWHNLFLFTPERTCCYSMFKKNLIPYLDLPTLVPNSDYFLKGLEKISEKKCFSLEIDKTHPTLSVF